MIKGHILELEITILSECPYCMGNDTNALGSMVEGEVDIECLSCKEYYTIVL